MNYFDIKPEDLFKERLDWLKEQLKGKGGSKIFISQHSKEGNWINYGVLNSENIVTDISLDELADSGVYLDTTQYHKKYDMKGTSSTELYEEKGKIFLPLDGLLRTKFDKYNAYKTTILFSNLEKVN